MSIQLSATQLRREIFLQAGGTAVEQVDQPINLLLERIFCESFAGLFGIDRRLHWSAAIGGTVPKKKEWRNKLETHVYRRLLGPRIGTERAYLHHTTEQLVAFWQASQSFCQWIVEHLWRARRELAAGGDTRFRLLTRIEAPLSLEFQQEGWTDSVIVTGIADLVLGIPGKRQWCIVELRLGQSCPEADMAQVCLYHQLLSSQHPGSDGTLALLEFKPHMEEHLFDAVEVKAAQKRFTDSIGRIAGVAPGDKQSTGQRKSVILKKEDRQKCFEQGQQLISIFRECGKVVSLAGDPLPGPAFIRYPIKLGKGIHLVEIQAVARRVQHRLNLPVSPYVHMSEDVAVVDIQHPDKDIVYFSAICDQLPEFEKAAGCAKILLGIDIYHQLRFADLSNPLNVHILASGMQGSGKSEWLRSALAGLMLTNTPDTLRLVLIDPQRDTFNDLKNSSFLFSSNALVYPDEQPAVEMLAKLVEEMHRRHRTLQEAGVDSRDIFVRQTDEKMPRIVCICDEYFDLISHSIGSRRAVEAQIFRLGVKSGSVGIHLIMATRQPSRQVIKGALDANIPARVGFKMKSAIDSNMLLNQKGAENLSGNGDLLFKDIGEPIRLQAPYIVSEQRIALFQDGA
jgi:hypothetical protein